MRQAFTIMAAFVLALFTSTMQLHAKDDNDHVLTSLWKSYYTARDNDRPQEEAAILTKIKKEALSKGLAWDYYDACQEYMDTRVRSNWKEYEKAREEFGKEIEKSGPPVAVFFYRFNYTENCTSGFLQDNRSRMLREHNPEFYSRDHSLSSLKFSKPLLDAISNDYEYALLSMYFRNWKTDTQIQATASSYFSGRYPLNAFADFIAAGSDEEKNAYLKKYEGKAAALLMEEDNLLARFDKLKDSVASGRDDFRLLNASCEHFSKARKAFTGSEKAVAECCTIPDRISEALNARKAGLSIKDGKCSLLLRNLDEATLSLRKEDSKSKEIFNRKVKNPSPSFYVTDTVQVDIDSVPDGDYVIYCLASGIDGQPVSYHKHSLSLAWRRDSEGLGVYVADYLSGEPLKKANFTLADRSGKTLAEAKGLSLDGFTCLPADFVKSIENASRGCTLEAFSKNADGSVRSSFKQSIYSYGNDPGEIGEEEMHCALFTDRSAFNPEETVRFKAVLYKGHYKLKACTEGIPVNAELFDTKGNRLCSLSLKTDGFGSVDGEFFLPRTDNNGMYSIRISLENGGRILRSAGIRVDDYVLPTFDLVWDKDECEYHPGDTVRVKGKIKSNSGHNIGASDISWSVNKYGDKVTEGNLAVDADGNFVIQFTSSKDDSWQHYQVKVKVTDSTGETKEFNRGVLIKMAESRAEPEEYFFKNIETEPLAVKVTAGDKPVWMVVELFTTGNRLLEKHMAHFCPADGEKAQTSVRFDYAKAWPDVVSLKLLYFQNGESYEFTREARRPDESWKLPLRFTRFLDTTAPGAKYSFSIKTAADVQCAATIFDRSTETVCANGWSAIAPGLIPAPSVNYFSETGSDRCDLPVYDDWIAENYGLQFKSNRMFMSAKAMMVDEIAPAPDAYPGPADGMEEEAAPLQTREEGYIRENFANTIAWEPCLISDKDGNINFSFTNADKLSTYYVQLFAHDRDMRNAVLRREMVVTIPVKIAVVEPQILRDSDRYVMRAQLSNNGGEDVPGTVSVSFFKGKDYKISKPVKSSLEKVIVPSKGTASVSAEISVPGLDELGIRIVFTPDDKAAGADGVFVRVPVLPAVQTVTEAHSSLLFQGEDREEIIRRLRGEFINLPGSEAQVREISILDLLKEAVPEKVAPKSDNAVALTEALYAQMLADGLNGRPKAIPADSELLAKILKLQTSEGGFAWFDGMEASPLVTCLVLERFHRMGIRQGTEDAVRFIDDVFFRRDGQPLWRGWISLPQYLYVRSLYPGEEFSSKGIESKRWKTFTKDAKAWLVPSGARGLNGNIFAKALRVETLGNLLSCDEGGRIASKWGIKFATDSRLAKSFAKDIESLAQYAEPHKCGGMYFPNAVMPFRGLLESEAYAHSHLCRLMSENGHKDIADGVRLWLMVQKETQKWDSDPGYLEALHSVFEGSETMLATKVVALKGSTELPIAEVKASGNGFSIERAYYKDGRPIAEGETLKPGDRISAVYKVWNEENRSFVKLSAPRAANLKPVQQLSGYSGRYYRNVLKDRTEFWYESFPEEITEIREDFYVQQSGEFQSSAVDIVSEYADHYRANDKWRGPIRTE